MLYTRKGDDGTTKVIGSAERFSKGSLLTHALGTLDEVNSFLGLCRAKADNKIAATILDAQENLFIVQAELAGAEKSITEEKVKNIESIIDGIEKELPPIKSFLIPGGTELGALLDITRTVVRRAERQMLKAKEAGQAKFGDQTLAYINRLSSLLYALVRQVNHESGAEEVAPKYN